MNKRITSIVLSLVMLFTMLATAVPVLAATPVELKVTADTTSANPGDTINYKVSIGAVTDMGGLEFKLDIPSGLTIDDGSISIPDGLETTIDSDGAIIVPTSSNSYYWCYSAQLTGYTGTSDLVILTFSCKVDDGITGTKTVSIKDVILIDQSVNDMDFNVTGADVNVTIPHVHVYDKEVATEDYLKSAATCTEAAVYYKSCECGAKGTKTFTSGSALGHEYTKKVENNTYLKTAASNCTEYNVYWYACSRCDANAKDDAAATDKYYTSTTAGNHSFTEKIEDAAHYVVGTGTDCQSVKKYYFDCAYCDQIGTTTWDSTTYGPHNYAATWSSDADGHWHECSLCHDKKDNEAHTPGAAATETTPQKCTECDYIITPALGHTHGYSTDWKTDADKHWHECSCGAKSEEAAHTASDWIIDTAATATTDGTKHKECTVCHRRLETGTIPATGYTITFDANGGTGTMADVTGISGEYTLPANGFTAPSGKQFKAWSVGGVEKAAGDKITVTANTTVTAVWENIPVVTYTITFDANGGSVAPANAVTGADGKLTSLPTPTRSGSYSFDGWYTAASGGIKVTTSYQFTADTTVYAHWTYTGGSSSGGGVSTYAITVKDAENGDVSANRKSASKGTTITLTVTPDKGYVLDTIKVLDSKDNAIKLTEKDSKFTFIMPGSKVTVEATFKAETPDHPFTDVPEGSYYEDAVTWAVDKGVTAGTSATTFAPDGICTRAQAVTFLWRAAGSPAPKSSAMPFTDVKADSYYYDAVLWAVEQGITAGTSATTFAPNLNCSRAQIVTFLYRAAGSPAVSGSPTFSDVAPGAYYAKAVKWAQINGITSGIGGGLFGSDNSCTRAQIVTFIYRYMEK